MVSAPVQRIAIGGAPLVDATTNQRAVDDVEPDVTDGSLSAGDACPGRPGPRAILVSWYV